VSVGSNIFSIDAGRGVVYHSFLTQVEDDMKYENMTIERLKEMLEYDPTTGAFTWRQRPHAKSRQKPGDIAGVLKNNGNGSYRYIGIDSRQYLASQLAWLYVHGVWAKGHVGVKNSDPSDLRADNLVEMKTVTGDHEFGTREGRARYQKDYWAQNQEYRRGLGYKRYYDITFEEYERRFKEQNGVCAICERPETALAKQGQVRWLSVDHDHDTKAVRGLLCNACNHTLGEMDDDPDRLRRAAAYIERHRTKTDVVKTNPSFPDCREHVIRRAG
jgi:hypothetical protein